MPDLTEIDLGLSGKRDRHLQDQEVSALLSGSRKGWKVVKLRRPVEFMEASKATLAKHFPTLEELMVNGSKGLDAENAITILSSCPRFRSLILTDDKSYESPLDLPAVTFIDHHPGTNTLKE